MKTRDAPRFRAMAEETRRYTLSVLNEEHREYLRNLPLTATPTVEGSQFLMCHAVPSDPLFEYRREESPLWLADEVGSGIDIELVGHTHIPFRRVIWEPVWSSIPEVSGSQSIAGPRPATRFGRTARISLGSVAYDVEQTVEKLRRLSLSAAVFQDLAFVLKHGSAPPRRSAGLIPGLRTRCPAGCHEL
jgi:diadenosine tetraphosphatase ApaH/serine/threonine PP2A family protein phosphatase